MKPITKPILNHHKWGPEAFTSRQMSKEILKKAVTKICLNFTHLIFASTSPRGQWVKYFFSKIDYFSGSAGIDYHGWLHQTCTQTDGDLECVIQCISVSIMRTVRGSYCQEQLSSRTSLAWWCHLTQWRLNKMADILQTTFGNILTCMKVIVFRSEFHWSMFLRFQLIIS